MHAGKSAQEAKTPPIHLTTVPTAVAVTTPYFVGTRNTFQTPPGASPLNPRVSMRLLESLNLALMEEAEDHSSGPTTPRSEESHESAATTVTCSTEGSRCATP